MKKRFSDEQIISFLREAEAGVSAREFCRKHVISEPTFYIYGLPPFCKWSDHAPVDSFCPYGEAFSKVSGADATEVAVASVTVVEHFNVIENIRPGHVPGFIYQLPDALFF